MQYKEYEESVGLLIKYVAAYCSKEPLVTDEQYDNLYAAVLAYETSHPETIDPASPTQKIGSVKKLGKDVLLTNIYQDPVELTSTSDLKNYIKSFKFNKEIKNKFHCSHVPTGIRVELTYDNGKFIRATTCRSKDKGSDITDNIYSITNFPRNIPITGWCAICGIITVHRTDLLEVNQSRSELHIPTFSSAEEYVYNSIHQVSPENTRSRRLKFYADTLYGVNRRVLIPSEQISKLTSIGFCTVRDMYCESESDILNFVEESARIKDVLPTDLEGILIRLDANLPNEAEIKPAVWKFAVDLARTNVRDIEWRVSKTGVVEPYANIDMTIIDGKSITEIFLNDIQQYKKLHIGKGAVVDIRKAHGKTPVIENIDKPGKYKEPPTVCPSCGEPLVEEGGYLKCENLDCPELLVSKLEFIFSPAILNIRGLNPNFIKDAVESKSIPSIRAIFTPMDSKSDKISQDILDAITRRAQQINLIELYMILGINGLGRAVAAKIVAETGSIDGFIKLATDNDYANETMLNPICVSGVQHWYQNKTHQEFLNFIKSLKLERIR